MKKYKGYFFEISNDLESLIEDEEIDIVVEFMGGVEAFYFLVKKILVK